MSPRRLYLDNAATSFPKPRGVYEAMARFAADVGASAGRGGYEEGLRATEILGQCRGRLNRLFNGEDANHFVFTLNCTDALNLAIHGLLGGGAGGAKAHVICTQLEHNSVLRPLRALEDAGAAEVTRLAVSGATTVVDPQDVRRAIRPETRLIAVAHASNVTGAIQPIREIGRITREHGIPFLVDAAQTAGHVPIDVRADHVDLLAAPGHKGLLGPAGTGFLYVRPGIETALRTVRQGGTGSASEDDRQPEAMPDKYEAGTHNAIGLAGLLAGVDWVLDRGVEKLAAHEAELTATFVEGVSNIEGLTYFGPQGVRGRLGVFCVRVEGFEPHELAAVLESSYGMLARAGLHCAPLAHAALGTLAGGGAVRLSFGPFLTMPDVNYATDALAAVAEGRGVV